MTVVDYILIGIVAISALISLFRGFAREALSLVTWAAAFVVALTFTDMLTPMFDGIIESDTVRPIAAFSLLFIITVIIGGLVNHFVGLLIEKSGLSGTDRALGVVFGTVRGALIVTAMVMVGNYVFGAGQDAWAPWRNATTVPHIQPLAERLQGFISEVAEERTQQIQTET